MFFTLVYAHKFRGVHIAGRRTGAAHFDVRRSRHQSPDVAARVRRPAGGRTSFSGLAAYVNGVATVGDEGRAPDRFNAAYVTANAFPLLGLSPSLGRLPFPDDDRPGGEPIVLLGSDAWRHRYDSDPQILGRSVLVNGVAGHGGRHHSRAVRISERAQASGCRLASMPDLKPDRVGPIRFNVVGRLRDGVSEDAARSEVETIFGGFEAAHPDTNRNVRARVVHAQRAPARRRSTAGCSSSWPASS